MTELCPIECINQACSQPDFIERNGTWLLTVIGVFTTCFGGMLTYFLRSRCRKVRCFGVECERDVLKDEVLEGSGGVDLTGAKVEKVDVQIQGGGRP